jgi:hypothetical protein
VYKGTLKDDSTVAVKVLSDASQQGPRQFLTEVLIIDNCNIIPKPE